MSRAFAAWSKRSTPLRLFYRRQMASTDILTDEELQHVYVWIDSIPLSRPKRNIARDFSDGGKSC
jgi:hypothetical protein